METSLIPVSVGRLLGETDRVYSGLSGP